MRCPIDDTELTPTPEGDQIVHHCPCCAGVHIPGRLFPEIRALAALEFHRRRQFGGGPVTVDKAPRIVCPHDGSPSLPLIFKDIEIDVCPQCVGVWLDAGELEKIAARVRRPLRIDLSRNPVTMAEQSQAVAEVSNVTGSVLAVVGAVAGGPAR